jgi:hypothetical protein
VTDDGLERLRAEGYRRVDVWIEATRDLEATDVSGDPDAISEAEEAVFRAGLAVAELAIGDPVRNRMAREIAHLDNQPDDPETEHRRWLLMQKRFLYDMRSLGYPKVIDVGVADIFRHLNGVEGVYSRPLKTGRGPKGFDELDLNLIRRYVLRVFVECTRTGKDQKPFLEDLPKGPTYAQFRDWSQRVPLEEREKEREMAAAIGEALRADRPLSSDQAALWDQIKHDDVVELYSYITRRDPKTVRTRV